MPLQRQIALRHVYSEINSPTNGIRHRTGQFCSKIRMRTTDEREILHAGSV